LQWTENYVCGEAASDELWEEAVNVAKALLLGAGHKKGAAADEAAIWESLPVSHWKRKRVRPTLEAFHMVPHPGDISSAESGEEREVVVGQPAVLHLEPAQDTENKLVEACLAAENLVQL
jgi:hypothetical protein